VLLGITDDQLEKLCRDWFKSIGYDYVRGYGVAPDKVNGEAREGALGYGDSPERSDYLCEALGVSSGGLVDLGGIAAAVASKKKVPKVVVESTILSLCRRQPLSLEELAGLLNRSIDGVRKDYLQPMIKDKRLRYRYPTSPHHPEQAYITSDEKVAE